MNATLEQLKNAAHVDAKATLEAIERDVRAIAKRMQNVHGGEWRVHIDHQHHFALVAMRCKT